MVLLVVFYQYMLDAIAEQAGISALKTGRRLYLQPDDQASTNVLLLLALLARYGDCILVGNS